MNVPHSSDRKRKQQIRGSTWILFEVTDKDRTKNIHTTDSSIQIKAFFSSVASCNENDYLTLCWANYLCIKPSYPITNATSLPIRPLTMALQISISVEVSKHFFCDKVQLYPCLPHPFKVSAIFLTPSPFPTPDPPCTFCPARCI